MTKRRPGIGGLALRGVSWTLGGQVVCQLAGVVTTGILAHLLSPRDFGLVAMALVLVGLATLFAKFGFGQALIQQPRPTQTLYSSVFWINLGLGTALSLLCLAVAPLLARIYKEPQVGAITATLSLLFTVSSIGTVPRVRLQKSMFFGRIAGVRAAADLISAVAAITMAVAGAGVWSLVAQLLVRAGVNTIGMALASGWCPSPRLSWTECRPLLRFSFSLGAYSIVDYTERNLDNFLVGSMLGSAALGAYSRAYRIMLLPVSQIFTVLNQVMYPAFAKIRETPERFNPAFHHSTSVLHYGALPCFALLFALSEPLVFIYLGPQWSATVGPLRALCILGFARAITISYKWIFLSLDRVEVLLRWQLIKTPLSLGMFAIALGSTGELILAIHAAAFVAIASIPIEMRIACRIAGLSCWDLLRRLPGPIMAATVAAAASHAVSRTIGPASSPAMELLASGTAGGSCFLAFVALVRPRSLATVITMARDYLKER